jgi:cell division protein FtsW (lipid II flippase)
MNVDAGSAAGNAGEATARTLFGPVSGTLLSLFVLLVGHILAIAEATREPFGRLVAIGVATLLGVQVLINCGMIVGLLPITGLTLPLVSYGGSSVLANALGLGLVLNIGLRPGYDVSKDPFAFADTHDAD